ncbi:hypothetical protein ACOSP7_031046 [Xanthoceras sorbifolium]
MGGAYYSDSIFLVHKDLLEYEHEVVKCKEADRKNCKELEAINNETQAYKDKLFSKAELEKKLTKEAKRCKALVKEMEQEMNASKAKYKGKIHGLKNQVIKAIVDLEHAYKMIKQLAGDLAKKDEKLA